MSAIAGFVVREYRRHETFWPFTPERAHTKGEEEHDTAGYGFVLPYLASTLVDVTVTTSDITRSAVDPLDSWR
ncbi:hypothetical protein [Amycolatopsis orientalis]|uniref:hypothetical protein n=1 Tax=Amycolatopsis orientalis TaxID=31958 RepID=UPI00056079EC|nr:hypothetical protein [Amycolatopsis orientalis]